MADLVGELEGKVAIVTGGGQSVGRAIALALAERGATVIVADVDQAGASETVAAVKAAAVASPAVAVAALPPRLALPPQRLAAVRPMPWWYFGRWCKTTVVVCRPP